MTLFDILLWGTIISGLVIGLFWFGYYIGKYDTNMDWQLSELKDTTITCFKTKYKVIKLIDYKKLIE